MLVEKTENNYLEGGGGSYLYVYLSIIRTIDQSK